MKCKLTPSVSWGRVWFMVMVNANNIIPIYVLYKVNKRISTVCSLQNTSSSTLKYELGIIIFKGRNSVVGFMLRVARAENSNNKKESDTNIKLNCT